MNKKADMWKPVFKINTAIARALMDIEAAKAVVEITVLSPAMEAQLRKQARIRSTRFPYGYGNNSQENIVVDILNIGTNRF